MSNLLEKSDVFVKSKRLDKKSGEWPNKIKFTSATKISLQKNIDYNFIDKAIERLNTVYSEMISAVEIAEKVKAEEEARNKLMGNASINEKIVVDEKISKITDASVVNARMKKVTIELLKLAGRIGTYKDHYGINVKKGFTPKSPKAISVQKLYADVYKSLMNKIDLYKMAEKNGIEVSEDGTVVKTEDNVPSWRKLFDNLSNIPSNVTVAMGKSKDEDEEEIAEFVQPSSSKVTEEDLSYRKMLGQLGDEFELIENYEKSANGVPSQFKEGFESRKQNLSKIFFDLTGIESKKKNDNYEIKDNTEFQDLIDKVNGYKDPLSEEEHKRMEESLNEYYNSEEVSSRIRQLNEKDVLYTFNQHMDDVIKAEIKENNKDATVAVVESTIDTAINEEELAKQRNLAELKEAGEVQARMLKTLYDYIDKVDELEEKRKEQERKELEEIRKSAEVEARRINETNEVIDAAHEEAQKLINEEIEEIKQENYNKILASSEEEAKRLFALDVISDSAEKEAQRINKEAIEEIKQENYKKILASSKQEAENIYMKDLIADSADVEAQRMVNEALEKENQDNILDSSKQEAERLFMNNLIADSADKEAQRMLNEALEQENQDNILESSKQEAERLFMNNLIIDSADVEAQRMIKEEKEQENQDNILESSKQEAERLFMNNLIIDSADEEAKKLQQNNEYLDILESAEVQASILHNMDKKEQLLEEERQLRERLKSISEEANKIDLSIAESVDQDEMDNTYGKPRIKEADGYLDPEIIDSAEKEAERLHEQNIILDSADKEAERLYEQNVILDSADKEAQNIIQQNELLDSAEKEAEIIYNNNIILDSAEKEAERLHDQNVIADSAEVEAERLHEQNVMLNSAEEEAQKIIKESKSAEKTNEKNNQVSENYNLQLLDNNDRYGELTNKSNPLLVKKSRIENINNRINMGNKTSKKKAILNSLKEELETGNYSFLQRSDNIENYVPNAKAA